MVETQCHIWVEGLVCHGDFFLFLEVQFLKELCFWEMIQFACLFHMFFLCAAIF